MIPRFLTSRFLITSFLIKRFMRPSAIISRAASWPAIGAGLGAAVLTMGSVTSIAIQPARAEAPTGTSNALAQGLIQAFNDPTVGYANVLDLNRLSSGKAIPAVPKDGHCSVGIPTEPLPTWAQEAGINAKE